MKYRVNYQHMTKGHRPSDDGMTVDIGVDDKGFALLPNVGDYVDIQDNKENFQLHGKVRSRLFTYLSANGIEDTCLINIVVEETSDDWGLLIKE